MLLAGGDPAEDERAVGVATVAARAGWDVVLAGQGAEDDVAESFLGDVRVLRWPAHVDPAIAPRTAVRLAEAVLRYPDRTTGRLVGRRLGAARRRVQERAAARAVRARDASPRAVSPLVRRASDAVTAADTAVVVARTLVHRRRMAATTARVTLETTRQRERRRAVGISDELDLQLGPRVEELAPDAVWAVGTASLDVAAGAVQRLRLRRHAVRLVYDAREDVAVPARRPAVGEVAARLERRAVPAADVAVASTHRLADALRSRYPRLPVHLVADVWVEREGADEPPPSLRERVGAPEGAVVLAVPDADHPDAVAQVTGLVDAVAEMDTVHLALLMRASTSQLRAVRDTAWLRGMRPRWHQVTGLHRLELPHVLRGATAVVVLASSPPRDTVTVPYGYSAAVAAGVPVLAHATRLLHEVVEQDGSGVVADLEDAAVTRNALRRLLEGGDVLAERLGAREAAPGHVRGVLDVLGPAPGLAAPPGPRRAATDPVSVPAERRVTPLPETRVLGVGPANFAGQGWAWAAAARRVVPGLRTDVFAVEQRLLQFPADRRIPRRNLQSLTWQLDQLRHVLGEYTHLLAEANRPVFGALNGDDLAADLPALRRHGVVVGLVMHGSEVRDPEAHRAREEWSPFREDDELVAALSRAVTRTRSLLEQFDGPVFVSTPDLLDDVPNGIWLPVVVPTDLPAGPPPLERDVPVVVHAPSSARLKGSALVDATLERLQREGVCEYRRIRGIAPAAMPAVLAEADVVLDQFALGSYGVLACEGMAAGRVVVGHVREDVRARVGRPLPIVEATPEVVEDVLRGLLAEREAARGVATDGPRFVEEVHDGRASGRLLAEHLLARKQG